jgi:hypothetical protein
MQTTINNPTKQAPITKFQISDCLATAIITAFGAVIAIPLGAVYLHGALSTVAIINGLAIVIYGIFGFLSLLRKIRKNKSAAGIKTTKV